MALARPTGTAPLRVHSHPDRRICSSLLLQQLLYYNSYYSAAWLVAHSIGIGLRVSRGQAVLAGHMRLAAPQRNTAASSPATRMGTRAHPRHLIPQFRVGLSISDPDVVRTVLTLFWVLAEPARLAAGYYGNLQENVSCSGRERTHSLVSDSELCHYSRVETHLSSAAPASMLRPR